MSSSETQADLRTGKDSEAHASVVVEGVGENAVRATVQTDAFMALVLIVFAALGVISLALYVTYMAIRRKD